MREDTVFVEKLALRTAESSLSVDGAVQQYLSTPIYNLQISSDKLSLPEIARLVPALSGITLQPSFNVKAAGPLDALKVEMNVQSPAGQMSGTVLADLMSPGQSVSGEVSVKHLDLALREPHDARSWVSCSCGAMRVSVAIISWTTRGARSPAR